MGIIDILTHMCVSIFFFVFFLYYCDITSNNNILQKINTAPIGLWEFCNTLAENTTQDVAQWLFLNFFCAAIERPDQYGLTPEGERLSRLAQRTLVLISDVLRNKANKSDYWIEDLKQVPEEIKQIEHAIQKWALNKVDTLTNRREGDVSWEQESKAINGLVNWMYDKKQDMLAQLSNYTTKHVITFTINAVISALKPGQEKTKHKKTPSRDAPASPLVSTSSAKELQLSSPVKDPKEKTLKKDSKPNLLKPAKLKKNSPNTKKDQ